jgi:hypothetical protein
VRALTVVPGRAGLAATKLRLLGLDVTVVERQHKPEKEALLADDFRQGITLITRRVPLEDAARALPHDPSQIKTVVEVRA